MGVATAAHTLPGAANPARVILAGEMEMGLGIHGEPGAYTAPTAGEYTGYLQTYIRHSLLLPT